MACPASALNVGWIGIVRDAWDDATRTRAGGVVCAAAGHF